MNKKITSSALAALMIAGSTSFSALAAMSNGTVVIGTKAFDLAYANDPANADEIGNAIVGMGADAAVYVKGFDGNWVENTTGKTVEASVIPAVTYKDAAGKVSEITKGDAGTVVVDGSLKVKAVKAISNTKVQVSLEEAVKAVDAASFKVTVKGSDKALEVKSAVLESSKVVVLETAAMTAGTAYKLAADKEINFTGIGAEKVAPKIVSVKCVDTNQVEIEFDKTIDYTTATNIANYKLDNSAKVVEASLDSSRKVVTLTTEAVAANKTYKIEIDNLLGIDGVKISKITRTFAGKVDTTAPTAGTATAIATTNNKIKLTFNDEHGVDKALATDKANYSIKNGTTELEIVSIKALDEDENGYYEAVEIVTATQVAGKKYDITVSNLADGSVSKNVVKKPLTFTFYGRVADKTSPTVQANNVQSLNSTTVQLAFDESNALDLTTVLDASNYEFNGDLQAVSVKVIDDSDLYDTDAKTVLITTTEQTKDKSYTLTVKNVADEYGNAIKPLANGVYQKYFFTAKAADTKAPYVSAISAVNNTTVKITLDEKVTKATAEDPTNYAISASSSDLGTALKAKLGTDGKTVTLTTLAQVANTKYTVTINGLQDYVGNEVSDATAQFVAKKETSDIERPTILYTQQVNVDEVWMYFSEAVEFKGTATDIIKAGTTGNDASAYVGLKYIDSINDDTVLVFKPTTTGISNNTTVYLNDFTSTWITDSANNVVDYKGQGETDKANRSSFFYSTNGVNEAPEVSGIEQIDAKTVRVRFNERIAVKTGVTTVNIGSTASTPKVSSDKTYIDFVANSGNFEYNKLVKVNFTTSVEDMTGKAAKSVDTEITPYITDSEKPFILNAYAVDNKTIEIEFNEGLSNKHLYSGAKVSNAGNYRLYKYGTDGKTKIYLPITAEVVDGSYSKVSLALTNDSLNQDTTYYLEAITGARDIAGNVADVRGVDAFIVQGTNKVDNGVISGVNLINNNKFKLAVETENITTLKVKDTAGTEHLIAVTGTTDSKGKYTFTTKTALIDTLTYVATTATKTYEFKGLATEPGITISRQANGNAKVIFGGITADHVIEVYNVTDATQINNLITAGQYLVAPNATDLFHVVVRDAKNGNNVVYGALVGTTETSETYSIPSISVATDANGITEGTEAGEVLTVSATNETFKNATNVTVDGLPQGLTASAVVNGANINITLAGTSTDYDVNQTVTVTVGSESLTNSKVALSSTFVITAIDEDAVARQAALSALNASVTTAQGALAGKVVGTSVGEVLQADHDVLHAAITTAQAVVADATKTTAELVTAKQTLDAAVTTFNGKVIQAGNPAALNASVTTAQGALAGKVVGTSVGEVLQADHDALATAITTAQAVVTAAANKTQAELDNAQQTLDAAVTAFNAAVIQ